MLTFTSKTKKSDKMSDLFYTSAHTYLENELPKILNTTKDLTLTPLPGGIVGTTYEFTHPETQHKLVVKIEDFEDVRYDALLAAQVTQEYNIPHPKLLYFKAIDYESAKLSVKVFQKVELPIYAEYLKDNPGSVEGIISLGKTVRKIHQKETQRYSKFKNLSFKAKDKDPMDYLQRIYLHKEYEDFYVNEGCFSREEISKLYKTLDRPDLFKNKRTVLCHGDIHLNNCFYDSQQRSVILFDYSCKSMPVEFDLAVYKYKTLKHKALFKIQNMYELFRTGYGQADIDEELVDLLLLYQLFSKGVLWMKEGKMDRGTWTVNFLREALE